MNLSSPLYRPLRALLLLAPFIAFLPGEARAQVTGSLNATDCSLPDATATSCGTNVTSTISGNYYNCLWMTAPTERLQCGVGNQSRVVWLTTTPRTLELRRHSGGMPDGSDASRTAGALLASKVLGATPYNTAPTVSISAPAAGSMQVGGQPIVISANASDPGGSIAKVDFYEDWTLLGTDTSPPFSHSWANTTTGSHTVKAIATDNLGATATSANVTFSVNFAPTVSLTAPASGTVVQEGSGTTLAANASDSDGGIVRVEFYDNGALLGSDTSSPYSYNWLGVSVGSHSVTAKAIDNIGGVATSAPITVIGNQKPNVTLTAPANGASYLTGQTVTLTASASDTDGSIASVAFFDGSTLLFTDTAAPFTYNWSTSALGGHALTARATDNRGATRDSAVVNVTITQHPPTVSMTAPANGTVFTPGQSITLSANASDVDGSITQVQFYANGSTLVGTDATAPYSVQWAAAPIGTHSITAYATDNAGGGTSSTPVSIIVNSVPTASITAPTTGAVYQPGQVITLSANASDADGTISKVEFYDGATLLGTDTSAPFSFAWSGASVGTHSITARATDNRTTVGTSVAISLRVNQVPAVSVTAPVHNSAVLQGGSSTLTANATDTDGTISKVEFYDGATLLATDTGHPFTWTWIGVSAGNHVLTAKAYDSDGAITTSAPVTLIGNRPPDVPLLTAPASGASYASGQSITLSASASDPDAGDSISKVEFRDGTTVLNTDTAAPYSYVWSGATTGTHNLTARAFDTRNATRDSSVASVTVNQLPPTVSLTAPVSASVYQPGASIPITATASDSDGSILSVSFYANGALLGTDTTSPYSFAWATAPIGTHTLMATTLDNSEATASSTTRTVIVNSPPSGAFTAPANASTHAIGAPIALTANASDTDGSITAVEFLDGETLLHRDEVAPYAFTWTNAAAGSHTLALRITDNSPRSITVSGPTLLVNTAPSVSITAPVDDTAVAVNSTVAITAVATDSEGTISSVEFFIDGASVGTDTAHPYNHSWIGVTAGAHTLTAKASDQHGLTAMSSVVDVIGDLPPTITLTAPQSPASIRSDQSITFTAAASDPEGPLLHVAFFDGETLLATDASADGGYTHTMTGAELGIGSHSVRARATDSRGVWRDSNVATVTVTSPPPSVTIRHPINHQAFRVGATVNLVAAASDPDGIAGVGVNVNGNALPVFVAPGPGEELPGALGLYSHRWYAMVPGVYRVSASALDVHGVGTTSTPDVTFKVHYPPNVLIKAPLDRAYSEPGVPIDIQIETWDDWGVAEVNLAVGDTFLQEFSPPTPCQHDTSRFCSALLWQNPPLGRHVLSVSATDSNGETVTQSIVLLVGVQNDVPFVTTLVSPSSGTRGNGPILLAADVDGADDVEYVEFFDDDAPIPGARDYDAPYEFVLEAPREGKHQFVAVAHSLTQGNAPSQNAEVTVTEGENVYPTINVVSGQAGVEIGQGDPILIAALADDSDGAITEVRFYAQDVTSGQEQLIESFTEEFSDGVPYMFSWVPYATGKFRIYATATDDDNATTRSASATNPILVRARKDGAAGAIGVSPESEYAERIKAASAVAPLTSDLFGEQISLYNGSTDFVVTDVDLPGNSSLPVRVQRRLRVEDTSGKGIFDGFGDWELDVPYMHGTFNAGRGWTVGANNATNRCSAVSPPYESGAVFQPEEVWHGNFVHLPQGGDQELLVNDNANIHAATGNGFPWITSGLARVSCTPSVANGRGEGFVVETPDGTKYTFGYMIEKPTRGLQRRYKVSNTAFSDPLLPPERLWIGAMTRELLSPGSVLAMGGGFSVVGEGSIKELWFSSSLARKRVFLMATKVEDRFGNSVAYTYNNEKLTAVTSNDGRKITLEYDRQDRISKVKAGSAADPDARTWTYGYAPSGPDVLTSVTLPPVAGVPESKWTYQHTGLLHIGKPSDDGMLEPDAGFPCDYLAPHLGSLFSLRATHPSGATGVFDFGHVRHRRTISAVTEPGANCLEYSEYARRLQVSHHFENFTLSRKTVTGPALQNMIWRYSHDEVTSDYACEEGSAAGNCKDSKVIRVLAPDGSAEDYEFGVRYGVNEGRLLRTLIRDKEDLKILRETSNTYFSDEDLITFNPPFRQTQTIPSGTYDKTEYGRSFLPLFDPLHTLIRPVREVSIVQDGVEFKTAQTTWDELGRSKQTVESSAREPGKPALEGLLTYSRTRNTTYYDNATHWLMGQVASVTEETDAGPKEIQGATYDAKGLPTQQRAFGRIEHTLGWHPNGTLAWVQASGQSTRNTTLGNYYRGIAREITLPDQNTLKAEVSDFGEIEEVTDQLNRKTSYNYDALGRLRGVTYPIDPNNSWNTTIIDFAKVGEQWQRTETSGQGKKHTLYDAFWRPVQQHSQDVSRGEHIFVKREFDHDGRETFASFPSATPGSMVGTWTDYDALGRVTSHSIDAEPEPAVTETRYVDGFRTLSTNPRLKPTETRYQVWGAPSYDLPTHVAGPLGVVTEVMRDRYGKPITLARTGPFEGSTKSQSRHYLYDEHERLCANGEPESGWTVVQYNTTNQIAWRATLPWASQVPGSATCSTVRSQGFASATRSQIEYTSRDQILSVDHPAGTDDLGFTYYPDGAMHTATSGNNAWTYAYNSRGLLESEDLRLPATPKFTLDWRYDGNGAPAGLIYPGGLDVDFGPDAFGRARKAEGSAPGVSGGPRQPVTFASGATYHPGGMLAGFLFGNQIARAMEPNLRQLPERISDTFGGASILDLEFAYDANGNLATLTDRKNSARTRTLDYDDRDRLVSSSSADIGTESFNYDPLDNVVTASLSSPTPASSYQRLFHYNASNQLASISGQGSGYGYAYNARGDVTTRSKPDGTSATFTFDHAQRITAIALSGAVSAPSETYGYDAHGLRVLTERAGSGDKRYQVYGRGGQLLHVDDPRDGKIDYVYLGKTLVAQRAVRDDGSSTTTFQHTDSLGTPVVETNASGAPSVEQQLAPYGERYDGQYRDGPGFTGHATDAATGLSYMQQRYYDPVAMRFLSPDPVAARAGSFSRYWYANNNPYSYVDPDGREGIAIRHMERDIEAMNSGQISRQEFMDRSAARGVGAVIGLGIVAGGYKAVSLANAYAANKAAVFVGELLAGDALGGVSLAAGALKLSGTAHEMLKGARDLLAKSTASAAEKVAVFDELVPRISSASNGAGWAAAKSVGADGSTIYSGGGKGAGSNMLVIDSNGKVFTGKMNPETLPASNIPNYEKLQGH